MHVIKAFWDDPYATEIETIVTSIDGDYITVNKTIQTYETSFCGRNRLGTYLPIL